MSKNTDPNKDCIRAERPREERQFRPLSLVGQKILIGTGTLDNTLGNNNMIKPARVRKRQSRGK